MSTKQGRSNYSFQINNGLLTWGSPLHYGALVQWSRTRSFNLRNTGSYPVRPSRFGCKASEDTSDALLEGRKAVSFGREQVNSGQNTEHRYNSQSG